MSEWTEELKADVIKRYKDAEPNADNSMDIVNDIAEEIGKSPNGVRRILSQADVYVKKTPATKSSSSSSGGEKKASTRVSKDEAHARLNAAIEAAGQEADSEIVSKLTGKAALHFAEIIEAVNNK